MLDLWDKLKSLIKYDLNPDEFNAWIQPLQVQNEKNNNSLVLIAPNKYVKDFIENSFSEIIQNALDSLNDKDINTFEIAIGRQVAEFEKIEQAPKSKEFNTHLNPLFSFDTFIEGKSNQLASVASKQVAKTPGLAYNPLFIYGATGLGKTHLMHAIGRKLVENGHSRVLYIRSERFVRDMIAALQHNTINKFKNFYHSLDALLIDDVQFLAGKERSQEEFFHSFNYLLEDNHQVVVTCDRYPREIEHLEDRLISRFGSGLTVSLEPPEYESRVAILIAKSELAGFELPDEVAYFIARLVKSNVRELEGALNNVYALARLTNSKINLKLTKTALRDLISAQDRIISIDNIQKIVAEHFNLNISDLVSKSRSRSIARPRQICMALAKELTEKSLPEIGQAFGGRDHTTVIHAVRKIKELKASDTKLEKDYKLLMRKLSR